MIFKSGLALLLSAALAVSVFGQRNIRDLEQKIRSNPNDESALMELGRLYHDQAASGNTDFIGKGVRCFDQIVAMDSANAVALAYRGSLWTMQGRESWWPPNKLSYMRRGSEELDRAVEMAPDNIMVHLIRGINGLGQPEYTGRLLTSLEDFILLLRRADFPEQTKELKAVIFYYGGLAHKRADDYDNARELFKRAIAILPGSDFAKRSQDELKDMGS